MLLTAPLAAILLLVLRCPSPDTFNITGAHDLIRKDQARARNMFAASKVKRSGSPASSLTGPTSALVLPLPQAFPFDSLLIDTGCGNIWIGGGKAYVRTGSSTPLPGSACNTCGFGSCEGFSDTVTLSPTFVFQASIGVASTSQPPLASKDLMVSLGALLHRIGQTAGTSSTGTPTDNLFSQGIIPAGLVSVSFEPTTNTSVTNGELTFGSTPLARVVTEFWLQDVYAYTELDSPATTTFPASEFGGIDESIRYGASTTILSTTAGIVDSGTTLILIATDAFNRYKTVTGAILDASTGLLRITSTQFNNLQSLFFTAGGISFELTANAQIWPRALNTFVGGTSGNIYLVVNDIGAPSGEGLDFINGYTFLERFYAVFDNTNNRIGFATTPFTTATTN
ncbi:aspartic peptidase A1 [Lactarius sanguifluus]|nr:aspartic peptidase A1 [Lactarius sanguifluus]